MAKKVAELTTDMVGECIELFMPAALSSFDKIGVVSGYDSDGRSIKLTVDVKKCVRSVGLGP